MSANSSTWRDGFPRWEVLWNRPSPSKRPSFRVAGIPRWLRGLFFSLGESALVGAAVFFLAGTGAIIAAILAATVVFCLRIERRVQRQINPGDRQLLEKLTESLPGMVYQCHLTPLGKCSITYANSALGWIYEQDLCAMQKDCSAILDLVHPDDRTRIWESLRESAMHGTPWRGEYRVVLPRQGIRWRLAQAQVERLSDGGSLWHGFIADVTWRKEAEARMQESQHREEAALRQAKTAAEEANRLKSDLIAMVSHEIRTPLNGVIGFAELLKSGPLTPEQHEYAVLIGQSGEHLLAMVNNTLDLARIENGTIPVNPRQVVLAEWLTPTFERLRPLAVRKGLTYRIEIAPGTPMQMVGDSLRLDQVVTNLLGNALKFTEHGSVELQVSTRPGASGLTEWTFAVEDTGPGIPDEKAVHIFDAFYQATEPGAQLLEGSGLGLSISRKLALLLGGDLHWENRADGGSRFVFTITAPSSPENPAT